MIRLDSAYYPPILTANSGHLRVGGLHEVYWEEYGNPIGIPIVFLHGGPGGGIRWYHSRSCDPKRFRIVNLDQRGCGRSRPFGSIEQNTTQLLVSDLEILRQHLSIDRWIIVGDPGVARSDSPTPKRIPVGAWEPSSSE